MNSPRVNTFSSINIDLSSLNHHHFHLFNLMRFPLQKYPTLVFTHTIFSTSVDKRSLHHHSFPFPTIPILHYSWNQSWIVRAKRKNDNILSPVDATCPSLIMSSLSSLRDKLWILLNLSIESLLHRKNLTIMWMNPKPLKTTITVS